MSTPPVTDGHSHDEPVDENLPARDDLYANPGLEEHHWRPTDVDPKAEKRAERQVAALFTLSAICTVLLLVSYFTIDAATTTIGGLGAQNLAFGLSLAGALLGIGIGIIQWARKLMADREIMEYRHPAASSDEDRAATIQALSDGLEESGIGRRPLVRNSLLGAVGLLGLPAVVFLRDLGPTNAQVVANPPFPGSGLEHTVWTKGMRVVRDVVGTPIRPADLEIGDLVNAEPEALFNGGEDGEPLRGRRPPGRQVQGRRRPRPDGARRHHCPGEGRENWSVDGILCYSKICTHVGCPISLYERTTHHLLCPCHQSTFDLADAGSGRLRPGRPAAPPAAARGRRRGLPRRAARLQRTGRTELLGAWLIMDHQQGRQQQRDHRGDGPEAEPGRRRRHLGRRAPRPRHDGQEEPPQGLPGPLVLHAGRDRAVELRRPAAHRRLPDAVVHAEHGRGPVQRLLRPAARHPHVRGLRLDAEASRSTSAVGC